MSAQLERAETRNVKTLNFPTREKVVADGELCNELDDMCNFVTFSVSAFDER